MCNIKVVNRKLGPGVEYIGRGSALGNPFAMNNYSDAERDRVCDAYKVWINRQILLRNPQVIYELNRLHKLAKHSNSLELSCFCAPKRCHGDTIKALLEEKL